MTPSSFKSRFKLTKIWKPTTHKCNQTHSEFVSFRAESHHRVTRTVSLHFQSVTFLFLTYFRCVSEAPERQAREVIKSLCFKLCVSSKPPFQVGPLLLSLPFFLLGRRLDLGLILCFTPDVAFLVCFLTWKLRPTGDRGEVMGRQMLSLSHLANGTCWGLFGWASVNVLWFLSGAPSLLLGEEEAWGIEPQMAEL